MKTCNGKTIVAPSGAEGGASLIKFFKRDRFAVLAGCELLEIREGYARARMTVAEHHLNGGDFCQGGAIFTLADLAFAAAVNSHLVLTVSTSSNITFFRSPRHHRLCRGPGAGQPPPHALRRGPHHRRRRPSHRHLHLWRLPQARPPDRRNRSSPEVSLSEEKSPSSHRSVYKCQHYLHAALCHLQQHFY